MDQILSENKEKEVKFLLSDLVQSFSYMPETKEVTKTDLILYIVAHLDTLLVEFECSAKVPDPTVNLISIPLLMNILVYLLDVYMNDKIPSDSIEARGYIAVTLFRLLSHTLKQVNQTDYLYPQSTLGLITNLLDRIVKDDKPADMDEKIKSIIMGDCAEIWDSNLEIFYPTTKDTLQIISNTLSEYVEENSQVSHGKLTSLLAKMDNIYFFLDAGVEHSDLLSDILKYLEEDSKRRLQTLVELEFDECNEVNVPVGEERNSILYSVAQTFIKGILVLTATSEIDKMCSVTMVHTLIKNAIESLKNFNTILEGQESLSLSTFKYLESTPVRIALLPTLFTVCGYSSNTYKDVAQELLGDVTILIELVGSTISTIESSENSSIVESSIWLQDLAMCLGTLGGKLANSIIINTLSDQSHEYLKDPLFKFGLREFELENEEFINSLRKGEGIGNDLVKWIQDHAQGQAAVFQANHPARIIVDKLINTIFLTVLYHHNLLEEAIEIAQQLNSGSIERTEVPPSWLMDIFQSYKITNIKKEIMKTKQSRAQDESLPFEETTYEFIIDKYFDRVNFLLELQPSQKKFNVDESKSIVDEEIFGSLIRFILSDKSSDNVRALMESQNVRCERRREGLKEFSELLKYAINDRVLACILKNIPSSFEQSGSYVNYLHNLEGCSESNLARLSEEWKSLYEMLVPSDDIKDAELCLILLTCWRVKIAERDIEFLQSLDIFSTLKNVITLFQPQQTLATSGALYRFNSDIENTEEFTRDAQRNCYNSALKVLRLLITQSIVLISTRDTFNTFDPSLFDILFLELKRSLGTLVGGGESNVEEDKDCQQLVSASTNFRNNQIGLEIHDVITRKRNYSLFLWVYMTSYSSSYNRVIYFRGSDIFYTSLTINTNRNFEFIHTGGSNRELITSDYVVPLNQWVHVACVVRGKMMQLYINGELEKEHKVTEKTCISYENLPVYVGKVNPSVCSPFSQGFHGKLSDMRFATRPLEAEEIKLLAKSGHSTERSDNYCFELLSLLYAVHKTQIGMHLFSNYSTIPLLITILRAGTSRIKSICLKLLRHILSESEVTNDLENEIPSLLFGMLRNSLSILPDETSEKAHYGLAMEIVMLVRVLLTKNSWRDTINKFLGDKLRSSIKQKLSDLPTILAVLYIAGGHRDVIRLGGHVKQDSNEATVISYKETSGSVRISYHDSSTTSVVSIQTLDPIDEIEFKSESIDFLDDIIVLLDFVDVDSGGDDDLKKIETLHLLSTILRSLTSFLNEKSISALNHSNLLKKIGSIAAMRPKHSTTTEFMESKCSQLWNALQRVKRKPDTSEESSEVSEDIEPEPVETEQTSENITETVNNDPENVFNGELNEENDFPAENLANAVLRGVSLNLDSGFTEGGFWDSVPYDQGLNFSFDQGDPVQPQAEIGTETETETENTEENTTDPSPETETAVEEEPDYDSLVPELKELYPDRAEEQILDYLKRNKGDTEAVKNQFEDEEIRALIPLVGDLTYGKYSEDWIMKALKNTNKDVEESAIWIENNLLALFSEMEDLSTEEIGEQYYREKFGNRTHDTPQRSYSRPDVDMYLTFESCVEQILDSETSSSIAYSREILIKIISASEESRAELLFNSLKPIEVFGLVKLLAFNRNLDLSMNGEIDVTEVATTILNDCLNTSTPTKDIIIELLLKECIDQFIKIACSDAEKIREDLTGSIFTEKEMLRNPRPKFLQWSIVTLLENGVFDNIETLDEIFPWIVGTLKSPVMPVREICFDILNLIFKRLGPKASDFIKKADIDLTKLIEMAFFRLQRERTLGVKYLPSSYMSSLLDLLAAFKCSENEDTLLVAKSTLEEETSITLEWIAQNNIESYNLEQLIEEEWTNIYTGEENSFTVHNLLPSSEYQFRLNVTIDDVVKYSPIVYAHTSAAPFPDWTFMEEEEFNSSSLEINDMTIVKNTNGGVWDCVLMKNPIRSGQYYFEVKINNSRTWEARNGNVWFGLTSKESFRINNICGFGIMNFRIVKDCTISKTRVFGDHFGTGDVLGVLIDMDQYRMGFWINYKKMGNGFVHSLDIPQEDMFVVMGLKDDGTKMTVLPGTTLHYPTLSPKYILKSSLDCVDILWNRQKDVPLSFKSLAAIYLGYIDWLRKDDYITLPWKEAEFPLKLTLDLPISVGDVVKSPEGRCVVLGKYGENIWFKPNWGDFREPMYWSEEYVRNNPDIFEVVETASIHPPKLQSPKKLSFDQFCSLLSNSDSSLDISIVEAFESLTKKDDNVFDIRPEQIINHLDSDHPEDMIIARTAVIRYFNSVFEYLIRILSLKENKNKWSLSHLINQNKDLILFQVKEKFFQDIIFRTQYFCVLADDDFQDPDALLQIELNRQEASDAITIQDIEDRIPETMFGQLMSNFEDNSSDDWEVTRLHAVGPLDAGQKRVFRVTFANEGVYDYGGPYREVFIQCCEELQTPGLLPFLLPSPNQRSGVGQEQEKFIVNPALNSQNSLEQYQFLGRIIGMAIRGEICLPLNLPSLFWKRIVGDEVERKDIEKVDYSFAQFLSDLKNTKEEDFVIDDSINWTVPTYTGPVELVPNGSEKPITYENRMEYIEKAIEYKLKEGTEQINAIKQGIGNVILLSSLSLFSWRELEYIVCGSPHVDFEQLQQYTVYEGVSRDDPHIEYFWKALNSLDESLHSAFLRFTWARSRLPSTNLNTYFKIQYPPPNSEDDPDSHLPTAQTCFFAISIPKYTSAEVAKEKITYAIENCVDLDNDYLL
eukprot:TRINITY_DN1246_c0_g1_i2.p1 TRINITY_DN1246_c0_g1~~TRINITY_DN1246_c0_g1_i2.p1  ORF type:complete len:3131 (-),score=718.92 TRINITY_DN1246_c0_g1_i2:9-8252(-)